MHLATQGHSNGIPRGMMTTEMQGRVVHMCRAKGFKGHGEYEEVKGFEAQHFGHTITAEFDPDPE